MLEAERLFVEGFREGTGPREGWRVGLMSCWLAALLEPTELALLRRLVDVARRGLRPGDGEGPLEGPLLEALGVRAGAASAEETGSSEGLSIWGAAGGGGMAAWDEAVDGCDCGCCGASAAGSWAAAASDELSSAAAAGCCCCWRCWWCSCRGSLPETASAAGRWESVGDLSMAACLGYLGRELGLGQGVGDVMHARALGFSAATAGLDHGGRMGNETGRGPGRRICPMAGGQQCSFGGWRWGIVEGSCRRVWVCCRCRRRCVVWLTGCRVCVAWACVCVLCVRG